MSCRPERNPKNPYTGGSVEAIAKIEAWELGYTAGLIDGGAQEQAKMPEIVLNSIIVHMQEIFGTTAWALDRETFEELLEGTDKVRAATDEIRIKLRDVEVGAI